MRTHIDFRVPANPQMQAARKGKKEEKKKEESSFINSLIDSICARPYDHVLSQRFIAVSHTSERRLHITSAEVTSHPQAATV